MKLHVTRNQIEKIKRCAKKRKSCKIRIQLNKPSNRNFPNLTQKQIFLIQVARKTKKSFVTLELSLEQTGGFLPLLIPGLIAAGKALGLGAAGYLGSKVMSRVVGKGLKLKKKLTKRSKGVFLPGTVGKSRV